MLTQESAHAAQKSLADSHSPYTVRQGASPCVYKVSQCECVNPSYQQRNGKLHEVSTDSDAKHACGTTCTEVQPWQVFADRVAVGRGREGQVNLHALHEGQLLVFLLQLVDEEDLMHFGGLVQRFALDLLEVGITELGFACLLLLQLLLSGKLALDLNILNCLHIACTHELPSQLLDCLSDRCFLQRRRRFLLYGTRQQLSASGMDWVLVAACTQTLM